MKINNYSYLGWINRATEFIFESNLIENIEIPFDEIKKEWAKTPIKGHAWAVLSASNYALRFSEIIITEKIICDWQRAIIQEQNSLTTSAKKIIFEGGVGHYRGPGKMFVGNKLCIVPSQAISLCMQTLIKEINYFQRNPPDVKEKIIEKIADFHLDFLWIHPFVDGNGRTARVITWYLFEYFRFEPFVFTNSDKHETYYKAFDGMRNYFFMKSSA